MLVMVALLAGNSAPLASSSGLIALFLASDVAHPARNGAPLVGDGAPFASNGSPLPSDCAPLVSECVPSDYVGTPLDKDAASLADVNATQISDCAFLCNVGDYQADDLLLV